MKPIVITTKPTARKMKAVNEQCRKECVEIPYDVYASTPENINQFNYIVDTTEVMIVGIDRQSKCKYGHIAFNRVGTILSLMLIKYPTVIIMDMPQRKCKMIDFNKLEEVYKWYFGKD